MNRISPTILIHCDTISFVFSYWFHLLYLCSSPLKIKITDWNCSSSMVESWTRDGIIWLDLNQNLSILSRRNRFQLEWTNNDCVLLSSFQARVVARHEEQEVTIGNSRTRIRHSLPAHVASLSNGVGLMEREDAEEEGSYLEPIRLQGPGSHQQQTAQQPQIWTSSTSRPLSSSSLISSNSSPMSPAAVVVTANVYANNDTTLMPEGEATNVVVASVASVEPVVPPPVAYANLHSSYPKLDELSDDHDSQHHLYINVGPDVVEVNTVRTVPEPSPSSLLAFFVLI